MRFHHLLVCSLLISFHPSEIDALTRLRQHGSNHHLHVLDMNEQQIDTSHMLTTGKAPLARMLAKFCGSNKNDMSKWNVEAAWEEAKLKDDGSAETDNDDRKSKFNIADWTITYRPTNPKLVTSMSGTVTRGCGTAVQESGHRMMDVLWAAQEHWKDIGYDAKQVDCDKLATYQRPRQFHTGHIIGAALGGTNFDPRFFVPQAGSSNVGGTWACMEAMGRKLADLSGCSDKIKVQVQLTYDAKNYWIPEKGTYSLISGSAGCSTDISSRLQELDTCKVLKKASETTWTADVTIPYRT